MIKTFCKLFYNKFISICYDTQKNSQDDIIIDFNKYDNINIDYKIQKKTDFYNGDFIENNSNLSDIHNENSYDDCKSKEDYSDIDDKYDKISDID